MNVTVRFFASLRNLTGESECTLTLPDGARLADLLAHLMARYPALDGYQAAWHFAVNQTHAEADTILHDGDQVAILPYVASG